MAGGLAVYLVMLRFKMLLLCVQEDTGQIMCQAQTGQALRDRGQGIAGIPARTLPRESRHSHFPYPEREGGSFFNIELGIVDYFFFICS